MSEEGEKRVISYTIPFGSWRNTYEYGLLFSLRQRKFIGKPHKGARWSTDYKLLPGKYLEFYASGYKDERGGIVRISEILADPDGDIKTLREVELEASVFASHCPSLPRIVEDFLAACPDYHDVLVPPEWVYTEKQVQEVYRLLTDKEYLEQVRCSDVNPEY